MMEVCRVCLARNVRMYDILEDQLTDMYERVTGTEINTADYLPQHLCWECFGRLLSANRFIQKALKTEIILSKKNTNGRLITISDIDLIDKARHKLESTLGIKFHNVNEYDFLFTEETVEPSNCGNLSADQIYKEVPIKIEPDNEEERIFIKKECVSEEDPFVAEVAVAVKEEVHNYITYKGAGLDDEESETLNADQSMIHIQRLQMQSELCTPVKNETFPQGDFEMFMEIPATIEVPQCEKSFVDASVGASQQITSNTCLNTLSTVQKKNKIILTSDDYPQKLFICDICDKSFSHKPTLVLHIQKHPKMHYCTYCSYKSYLKRNLFTHVNAKHIKSIVFNCPHCSYKANQKAHLSVHINAKHTKSNIFNCAHCSYKAYRNEHLLRHINAKHTISDILNCPHCNYKSCLKKNLELHIKVKHTEGDFLNCSHCSYKTNRNSHLLRHINAKHIKKEVFKCPHCIYKSFRKDTLEVHVNAKHTKSNFNCPYCSYKTYLNRCLVKHVNKNHAQQK